LSYSRGQRLSCEKSCASCCFSSEVNSFRSLHADIWMGEVPSRACWELSLLKHSKWRGIHQAFYDLLTVPNSGVLERQSRANGSGRQISFEHTQRYSKATECTIQALRVCIF